MVPFVNFPILAKHSPPCDCILGQQDYWEAFSFFTGVNEVLAWLAVYSSPVASYSWEVQAQMSLWRGKAWKNLPLLLSSNGRWHVAFPQTWKGEGGKSWEVLILYITNSTMVSQVYSEGCTKLKTNINSTTFSVRNWINAERSATCFHSFE